MGKRRQRRAFDVSRSRCYCSSSKSRSTSKKSNITAERLTLLPDFLIRSRCGNSSGSSSENVSEQKLRRSWRLCKRDQPATVSGYFSKLVSEENKSVFKEIKTKYGEKFESENGDEDFEENIFKQLSSFSLREPSYYREKIVENIENINKLLTGRNTRNMSGTRKRAYAEDEKENFPMKFPYIPQSKWVFQTPPNRKLNFRNVNTDTDIEPAVIETRQNNKVVYEMNKKINIDLSKFNNKQEIDIDKRYMVEVGRSNCMDQTDVGEEKINALDFLPAEPFELENHFLSLTCRPKKVTSTVSRISNIRRKRDIFEPQPGCSTDSDYKPNGFSETAGLNELEESFTFKFTSNESSGGSTTGHLFDIEGNRKNTFNFHF